jgi:hypothetical protein
MSILIPLSVGAVVGSGLIFFLTRRAGPGRFPVEPLKFSEKEVEGILEKAGFEILSKQQRKTVITNINGKDHFGFVQADYIVRRGRHKYVVVVKTGEGAADPNEPIMRRRLIEAEAVFSTDGILLVDADQGEIHRVAFHFPHETNLDRFFKILIAALVVGLVIGIVWMLTVLKLI